MPESVLQYIRIYDVRLQLSSLTDDGNIISGKCSSGVEKIFPGYDIVSRCYGLNRGFLQF
jgi:hypothetical protein